MKADTLTEGHCGCGLKYRRRVGAATWDEIVGLVDVTVPGYNMATEHRVVRSNGVIYRSEYVHLDPVVDKNADRVFEERDVVSIVPVPGDGV